MGVVVVVDLYLHTHACARVHAATRVSRYQSDLYLQPVKL